MVKRLQLAVPAAVLVLALCFIGYLTAAVKNRVVPNSLTVVRTPNQTSASTPDRFKQLSGKAAPTPAGVNLALNKPVQCNGYTQVYIPKNATDGKDTSYWEGAPKSYPDELTVDLGQAYAVTAIRIKLNPASVWSKRTQDIEIQSSGDRQTFTTLVAKATYAFDPESGNLTDIKLPSGAKTRYVKLIFTANTQATGGQAAEVEIYGPGK